MASIIKNSSKPAWAGMFQKGGHDMDRIVTACLDIKDLNVLAVCKRWRDNAPLISLKNRCVVEWRKDQAAIATGCDKYLVRFLRKNQISHWDLPYLTPRDGPLPPSAVKEMPTINGAPCSIAQIRYFDILLGRGVGLVFAIQSKKKGTTPLAFGPRDIFGNFKLQFRACAAENVGSQTSVENPLLLFMEPFIGQMRFITKSSDGPVFVDVQDALDAIAPLLSDTHQEIGLANRVMRVLPENSPPIPDAIPLVPPRPVTSTTFIENNFANILLYLCLACLIRYLWNLSRE